MPQPGMPISTMFCIFRLNSRSISSVRLSGMAVPVKSSAARFACATSMFSPPMQGMPSASACIKSAVRCGLYTMSSTPLQPLKTLRSTGLTPVFGYIPTGVVFTIISASACLCMFS